MVSATGQSTACKHCSTRLHVHNWEHHVLSKTLCRTQLAALATTGASQSKEVKCVRRFLRQHEPFTPGGPKHQQRTALAFGVTRKSWVTAWSCHPDRDQAACCHAAALVVKSWGLSYLDPGLKLLTHCSWYSTWAIAGTDAAKSKLNRGQAIRLKEMNMID